MNQIFFIWSLLSGMSVVLLPINELKVWFIRKIMIHLRMTNDNYMNNKFHCARSFYNTFCMINPLSFRFIVVLVIYFQKHSFYVLLLTTFSYIILIGRMNVTCSKEMHKKFVILLCKWSLILHHSNPFSSPLKRVSCLKEHSRCILE